jgi:hypothetical protein
MRTTLYFCVFFCILLSSCVPPPKQNIKDTASAFASQYMHFFPDETPLSKQNQELVRFFVADGQTIDTLQKFYNRFSSELKLFSGWSLKPNETRDFDKMTKILRGIQSFLENRDKNPSLYNIQYPLQRILVGQYAPLETRLQTIFEKLDLIPSYYQAAKDNLKTCTPELAMEAVNKHAGTFFFLTHTLHDSIYDNHLETVQLADRLEAAELAVKDYVAYCESMRMQVSKGK